MDEINFGKNALIGFLMILIGIILIFQDVLRLQKFYRTRDWMFVDGTVSSADAVNLVYRLVHFTYSTRSGRCNSSEMMPRNILVERLTIGSSVPVRYNKYNPSSAIIDYQEAGSYWFFICLNSIWIIAGIGLISHGN